MDSKGPLLGEWYDARTPANERVDEGRQGLYLQRKKAKHLSVGVALLLLCIVWFSNDAIGRLAHWRERIVARPCQKLAEEKMIFDFEDVRSSFPIASVLIPLQHFSINQLTINCIQRSIHYGHVLSFP